MRDIAIPILIFNSQGGFRILCDIANHLAKNNWRVKIYTSALSISSHTPFHFCDEVEIVYIYGLRNKYLSYLLFFAISPFRIKEKHILANFWPTFYSAMLNKYLRGSKVVYFVQGIESIRKGFLSSLLNYLCNQTYNSKKIIASNASIQKVINEKYKNYADSINIGLPNIFFNQKVDNNKIYDIVYFPRTEKFKRLDRLLAVLQKIEHMKIALVSQDMNLLNSIKSKACKNHHIDTFIPKDNHELIKVIDKSKICLFTSDYEGFGLPPLECMSRGLPCVIYPNYGSDSYVINKYNSIIVNNTSETLSAIYSILSNKDLYTNMSNNASLTAQSFKMERACEELSNKLDKIFHK